MTEYCKVLDRTIVDGPRPLPKYIEVGVVEVDGESKPEFLPSDGMSKADLVSHGWYEVSHESIPTAGKDERFTSWLEVDSMLHLVKVKYKLSGKIYCKVTDGVISAPSTLPGSYENVSGFESLPDSILAEYGFFPYVPATEPANDSETQYLAHSYEKVGSEVTDIWVVGALSSKEKEDRLLQTKANAKELVAKYKAYHVSKGVVVGDDLVGTDPGSLMMIIGAWCLTELDKGVSNIDWKMSNGKFKKLTKSDVNALAKAVGSHTINCYAKESALVAEIDAASTPAALEAIDLESHWPE